MLNLPKGIKLVYVLDRQLRKAFGITARGNWANYEAYTLFKASKMNSMVRKNVGS